MTAQVEGVGSGEYHGAVLDFGLPSEFRFSPEFLENVTVGSGLEFWQADFKRRPDVSTSWTGVSFGAPSIPLWDEQTVRQMISPDRFGWPASP